MIEASLRLLHPYIVVQAWEEILADILDRTENDDVIIDRDMVILPLPWKM